MGVYYKKTHKIAGINFLPRLTLAEYNNLTVKPEHWIRTDSPFDYSKTDVPKLTLAQYEDLAIKPKFWIRTDAPESYTHMSATQVDMTDSVSVFDYLTDLDANQVKYSNGVSVKDKIDADWTRIDILATDHSVNIGSYKNIILAPMVNGAIYFNSFAVTRQQLTGGLHLSIYQDANGNYHGSVSMDANNVLTLTQASIGASWHSMKFGVFVK